MPNKNFCAETSVAPVYGHEIQLKILTHKKITSFVWRVFEPELEAQIFHLIVTNLRHLATWNTAQNWLKSRLVRNRVLLRTVVVFSIQPCDDRYIGFSVTEKTSGYYYFVEPIHFSFDQRFNVAYLLSSSIQKNVREKQVTFIIRHFFSYSTTKATTHIGRS